MSNEFDVPPPAKPAGPFLTQPLATGMAYKLDDAGNLQPVKGDELSGQFISEDRLTAENKQELASMGWKPGQPIPADFPARLAAIQRARGPKLQDTDLAKLFNPTAQPDVPLSGLSPQQQAAAMAAIQQATATAVEPVAESPTKKSTSSSQPTTADIDSDLKSPLSDIGDRLQPHGHCPRCLHRLDIPIDVEITTEDKQSYIKSCVTLSRFTKVFSLLGGHLRAEFRSLSAAERTALEVHCQSMVRDLDIIGDGQYLYWAEALRLPMQLSRLLGPGGEATFIQPEYSAWLKDNPQGTPKEFYKQFCDSIGQDTVMSLLRQQLRHFNRCYETMMTRAEDPNFFTGTG